MGEAYRGLTIRFAADGTKVMSTLKAMNKAATGVQQELRLVNRALKFDGANEKALSRSLHLGAEQAGIAYAQVRKLSREMALLGKESVGGRAMKEIARETHNASSQAAHMLQRYNATTDVLAGVYKELQQVWKETQGLSKVKNPFKGWNGHDLADVEYGLERLVAAHRLTREEADKYLARIKELRSAFKAADAQNKKFGDIAAYKSGQDKLMQMTAQAKQYRVELKKAALQARETGFEEPLARASASVKRLDTQLDRLGKAMKGDPTSFRAWEMHADALKGKMNALEAENGVLQREINKLGSAKGVMALAHDAERLESEYRQAAAQVDKLADKLVKAEARTERLADEADDAYHEFMRLGESNAGLQAKADFERLNAELEQSQAETRELQSRFDAAAASARKVGAAMKISENESRIAANNAAVAAMANKKTKTAQNSKLIGASALTSLGMSMYSTVYPAAMMAGSYAIQSAKDIDSAYRDMRKTVQGTEEDFEAIRKSALAFGDVHFTSADDLLEIESIAGQLGVVVGDLESFSTTVSNLDIATDDAWDTEDIALWLGKMSNILHISSDEYDNFADTLVRLGNSEPALESDIAKITTRFGSMASIVGMSADEILALSTAATATGQGAEASGSALMRIMGRIEAATSGVTKAMQGLEGVDDLTEEEIAELEAEFKEAEGGLEGYAGVAKMSAEEFAKAWEDDPVRAFQAFIEGLESIKDEGGSVMATLKELGFNNVRDQQILQGLTQTTDVLEESLGMAKNAYSGLSDEFGQAGDAENEASKKAQGFSGQLQMLANKGQHLAAVIGDSATPMLEVFNGVVGEAVKLFESAGPVVQGGALAFSGLGVASGPVMTLAASLMQTRKSLRENVREYTSVNSTMARLDEKASRRSSILGRKYLAQADALKKTNKQIEHNNKLLASPVGQGYGRERLQARQNKLATKAASQEKALAQTSKKMAAASFLGGIGKMAGFAVVIALLEQFGEAVFDAMERSANFSKATDGLRETAENMKASAEDAKSGIEDMNAALAGSKSIGAYKEEAEGVIAEIAQLSDSMGSTFDSALSDSAMIEYWKDRIIELSEGFDGSAADLTMLKDAVQQYNDLTGGNLQVVNDLTGALSQNTTEIERNSEAYQAATMENAFASVAADAAKAEAKAFAEMSVLEKEREANEGEILEIMNNGTKTYEELSADEKKRVDELRDTNTQLSEEELRLEKAKESAAALKEASQEQLEVASKQAAEAKEAAKAEEKKAKSASAYAKALGGKGTFKNLMADLGMDTGSKDIEAFAAKLADAGISAERLGEIGGEAFERLYKEAEEAGVGIEGVESAMDIIEGYGFSPKEVHITEDGAVEVTAQLEDVESHEIKDVHFTVSSDGTVEAADEATLNVLKDLGLLGKKSVKPKAELIDKASAGIQNIIDKLAQVRSKTITITTITQTKKSSGKSYAVTSTAQPGQQASGGINRTLLRQVPRHASGALSGIVTRAMLTNQGLVGEDGDEAILRMGRQSAIVPLSNRRYVRPFARAVASEIPSPQTSQPNVMNVYLDGRFVSGGIDEFTTLGDLARGLRRKARS